MNPFILLILLLLALPVLELSLLMHLGAAFGALPTLLLVLITAVLGAQLMHSQGVGVLTRIQQSLARREVPTLELLNGAVVLLGGLLLLIPGFVTDAIGFLCLIPPLRHWLLVTVLWRWRLSAPISEATPTQPRATQVIEGEFHRESNHSRH